MRIPIGKREVIKEFLEVGKHGGKQYLLPLTCSYYVLAGIQDIDILEGKSLGEWLEYAKLSEKLPLRQCIIEGLLRLEDVGFSRQWIMRRDRYDLTRKNGNNLVKHILWH